MFAADMLASKVGNPTEVMVQDFIADRHTNMIGQVHVVGDIGKDKAARVNVGTKDRPHWITAYPIFPVRPDALPLALHLISKESGLPRRPIARDDAGTHARYMADLARLATVPVAVLFEHDGDALGASTASRGDSVGNVTGVRGEMVTGRPIRGAVEAAFDSADLHLMPDVLLLSADPMDGAVVLQDDRLTNVRHALAVVGTLLAGIALLSMGSATSILRRDRKRNERDDDVTPVAAMSAVIQRRRSHSRRPGAASEPRRPSAATIR
ncbi:hypothetical protein EF888_19765 [Silicimonas algicola]|nr:hypothetical protein [Silicimonas algicola]AZQ69170.1 hypothetical protein EF888_19765 [Silicimonas algicola]